MKASWWLLLVVILMHLALVVLGAAGMDPAAFGPLERAVAAYGLTTGSAYQYSFFAPDVGPDVRARFAITAADQSVKEEALFDEHNREALLRSNDIIGQFVSDRFSGVGANEPTQADLFRSLAASLAGTLFGRHGDAQTVTMRLERYEPISVEDYRRGVRGHWQSFYSITFRRVDQVQAGRHAEARR